MRGGLILTFRDCGLGCEDVVSVTDNGEDVGGLRRDR